MEKGGVIEDDKVSNRRSNRKHATHAQTYLFLHILERENKNQVTQRIELNGSKIEEKDLVPWLLRVLRG